MNLVDLPHRTLPERALVSSPLRETPISTRPFIPHLCHASIGVLGAVSVASACLLPGSVTDGLAVLPDEPQPRIGVEHPTGEFSVKLRTDPARSGAERLTGSGLLRTARLLFDGNVSIAGTVWDGKYQGEAV